MHVEIAQPIVFRAAWLLVGLVACISGCHRPQEAIPLRDLLAEGESHLAREDFDEAITAFDSLIASNPNHVRALFYRAVARDKRHDGTGAIAGYGEAIALHKKIAAAAKARRYDDGHNVDLLESELLEAYCCRGIPCGTSAESLPSRGRRSRVP